MKKPLSLFYGVEESPPFWTTAILGLQQISVLSIYLLLVVLVARAAGLDTRSSESCISLGMIGMALSTFLQSHRMGPTGSGYLAPAVSSAIYLQISMQAASTGGFPLVAGMTILAGLCELLFSRLFLPLRAFFPPVVSGMILLAVGIELGLVGGRHFLDVEGSVAPFRWPYHILVALTTLALMISFTIWGTRRLRLFAPFLGMLIGGLLAWLSGLLSAQALGDFGEARLFGIPTVSHISYRFSAAWLVPFLVAGFAAALRTIGVITTCQKINDADWEKPDLGSIQGGILADGIGCTLGGFLGVPGLSASPSAVGISQATGAASRVIAYAIAGWLILFSLIPKISSLFLLIPGAILGAVLLYTGSLMISSGITVIASHPIDLRKIFIIGLSLSFGLLIVAHPHLAEQAPLWMKSFTGTLLTVVTLSSVFLTALFRIRAGKQMLALLDPSFERDWEEQMRQWHVAPFDVLRAKQALHHLLEYLSQGNNVEGPIHVQTNYDETELSIHLAYEGGLPPLPTLVERKEQQGMTEPPFLEGLSAFFGQELPDKIKSSRENRECRISLSFIL